MKNPITYSDRKRKYFIWVSYWGIKVMKYFSSPEEAIDYIKLNPRRCMDIKSTVPQGELDLWLSDLKTIPQPEDDTLDSIEAEVHAEEKSSKIWPYVLLFLVVFVINFLNSPDDALVTLISSITQAVILLIVVGIFIGIKKLFRRGK